MARVCNLVCTMLFLATMLSFATSVSAQLLPEVILTCDDDAEINSGDTKTAIIICEAENPGTFQEKVSIQVESGELANAAPGSMIIAPGDVIEFQISLRSDEAEEPGEIPVNVTATITEVNGVPYPLGSSDSEEIEDVKMHPFLIKQLKNDMIEDAKKECRLSIEDYENCMQESIFRFPFCLKQYISQNNCIAD